MSQSPFHLRHPLGSAVLATGTTDVGRAPDCRMRLASSAVSRRHAELSASRDQVTVRDLGSHNGTFVNDIRVVRSMPLFHGDRLRFGDVELVVERLGEKDEAAETARLPAAVESSRPEDPTRLAHPLELAHAAATRAHDAGRVADAARLLATPLADVARKAEREGRLEARLLDLASDHLLKLASATRDGRWLDLLVRIHRALAIPPREEVTDELMTTHRAVAGFDRAAFHEYVAVLRLRLHAPLERMRVARLDRVAERLREPGASP